MGDRRLSRYFLLSRFRLRTVYCVLTLQVHPLVDIEGMHCLYGHSVLRSCAVVCAPCESSRGYRSVRLWLLLETLGLGIVSRSISRTLSFAHNDVPSLLSISDNKQIRSAHTVYAHLDPGLGLSSSFSPLSLHVTYEAILLQAEVESCDKIFTPSNPRRKDLPYYYSASASVSLRSRPEISAVR